MGISMKSSERVLIYVVGLWQIMEVIKIEAKKIGIAYTDSFASLGAVEKTFNNIVKRLEGEGEELYFKDGNLATFASGTSVLKFNVVDKSEGLRFTDLYISSGVYNIDNGKDFVFDKISSPITKNISVFDNLGNIEKIK